ncbi:mediator of RNA polymerase ii transcription subunit 19a, partial [Phtheirospermum japonicum]
GPRELTGAVDLISHYKLLPHHDFFCKKPLPVSVSDTHYLHNVVGDTEIRKGEGMQLVQLIQDTSLSRETKTRLQPFDLDILKEAFQLRETAPIALPSSEKGTPTIAGKPKSESKDKEKKHKKHKDKDRDKDKDKDKEHKKHKHRHKDRSKDKDKEKKKDRSGHNDSGNDHSKRHHEKVWKLWQFSISCFHSPYRTEHTTHSQYISLQIFFAPKYLKKIIIITLHNVSKQNKLSAHSSIYFLKHHSPKNFPEHPR